jgi:hypothetical protein
MATRVMSKFEFIVSKVLRQGDHALVDGRVGDGDSPIRLRDSFVAIRDYSGRREGDRIQIDYGPPRTVRLVVESIEAYRHSLDSIESGMTARLTLRGEGLDTLAEHTILSSA